MGDDYTQEEKDWFGDMNQEIEEYQAAQGHGMRVFGRDQNPLPAPNPHLYPECSNPKQAYGDAKPPLHLVPPSLALHASVGLGEGAAKYGAYNWRKTKVEALTYVGAVLRHMAAYLDGEDVDPTSATGKSHLDGAIASLAILVDAQDGGTLIDNRPPPGPAPRLVLKEVTK